MMIMAVVLPFAALMAQVTTSSLTGTVKGTDGASLVGATVSAIHTPSGTKYTTTTVKNGGFNVSNMRVGGPYTIEITYVGYEAFKLDEIYLKLADPFILNADLAAQGSVLKEVVVSAAGKNSLLNGQRTGTTTSVSSREISRMPSISRSLNDITRLTPQASSTSTGSIGGGNYRQNFITVDGSDFNNTFGIGGNLPANGSPISLDAIEEISINVTPYDVKQSGFIGSAMNAVTRSGTNKFQGSVYKFWRSEKQQGNKVGADEFIKQSMKDNTIGFRIGGPIIKDKLFFFINAEKGETTSPGQRNFAATTSNPYGNPNVARPSVDELNMISDYLLKNYGYQTGPYQGYDNVSDNTRLMARIDWNINSKHRLNVRYSQVESKSPSFISTSRSPLSGYSSGAGRTDINALWFKNSNYYQAANFYSLAAELNSQFGKVANTFRATWTHQNDPRTTDSEIFPLVDILKDGTPFTTFGYEPFSYGNLRDVVTYSVVDYLTWTTGKHNWTAGIQADIQSTKNGFQRFATSYYTFNSWEDFVSGAKPRDFALTYSLLPGYEQAFPRFKFAQYSAYGQDEIKFSNKFRLTLGLRVDMPSYLDVKEIQSHPLVDALTFENNIKYNTGVLPKNRLMWSPRVGFNWDVKGDRSLQVRGGTGIFTGRVPTVWIVAQSGDAGLIQLTQTFSGQANTPGGFNPDPAAYRPATQPKPGASIPSALSAMDPDFKFPQTWKSSLALDAKLPWGMVGTLEGILNKDLTSAIGRNVNLNPATALNVAGYPDSRPIYPSSNTDKFINSLTSAGLVSPTGTSALNAIYLTNSKKNGYYFSMTAKLDKQFSKGLFASAAYVKSFAKNVYDGSGDQLLNTWSLTPIMNDANNPDLSYANYVVPDRFVLSVSYRKEYLKHLATTLSLFYEGSIQGRYSYTYSADFNRDGQTNDLIYVPKDASEITFTDFTYNGVPYTAKQQSDIFFRLIENDSYLSSRRGKYAERNGAKMPWRNQFDVKIAQDLFTNIGNTKNTLQFTLDIFNVGNLLNKDWGMYKTVNAAGILVPTNTAALVPGGSVKPTFRLQTDRNQPVQSTYRNNVSLTSTYYMQFGLRYIFN
jgi:hypothetical protein